MNNLWSELISSALEKKIKRETLFDGIEIDEASETRNVVTDIEVSVNQNTDGETLDYLDDDYLNQTSKIMDTLSSFIRSS